MGTTLIYTAHSDTGTLTASSQDSVLLATNLQKVYPSRSWRANNQSTQHWIKVDFGSSKSTDYALIAGAKFDGPNGDQGPLLNATLYATNDAGVFASTSEATWNTSGTNLGAMIVYKRFAKIRFSSAQLFRYWVLFINYSVANPTIPELGRFVLGSKSELLRTHIEPWDDRLVTTSTKTNVGHQLIVPVGVRRPPIRVTKLEFIDLDSSDRGKLTDLFEAVDTIKPFFVDPFPSDTHAQNVLYGILEDGVDIQRVLLDRSNANFTVTEVR